VAALLLLLLLLLLLVPLEKQEMCSSCPPTMSNSKGSCSRDSSRSSSAMRVVLHPLQQG
jgi:hypothetical protein